MDADGYLSVWHNVGNADRYNIPMLARFRINDTQHGELIQPAFASWEVSAFRNPILGAPNGLAHYSFEYNGASNPYGKQSDQGAIPGPFLDYAVQAKGKYSLRRGQLYNPWEGLTGN